MPCTLPISTLRPLVLPNLTYHSLPKRRFSSQSSPKLATYRTLERRLESCSLPSSSRRTTHSLQTDRPRACPGYMFVRVLRSQQIIYRNNANPQSMSLTILPHHTSTAHKKALRPEVAMFCPRRFIYSTIPPTPPSLHSSFPMTSNVSTAASPPTSFAGASTARDIPRHLLLAPAVARGDVTDDMGWLFILPQVPSASSAGIPQLAESKNTGGLRICAMTRVRDVVLIANLGGRNTRTRVLNELA